jgi:hypothetical protein
MQKLLHHTKLLLVLFLITGFYSCERLSELYRLSDAKDWKNEMGPDKKNPEAAEDPSTEPVIIALVSRDDPDHSPARITLTNDDSNITVRFEVTETDWNFDMMYLEVGSLDLVPLDETGSYPAFWDFEYQYADVPIASLTFQIPLANVDECFIVLAQARVVDNKGNMAVCWSQGINPGWTAGPFYTQYCIVN